MRPCRITAVLRALFDRHGRDHECTEVLALDVRAMLSDLRRTRRAWRYEAKRQGLLSEWPPSCERLQPKYFKMVAAVKIMEVAEVPMEAEAGEAEKLLFDLEPKVDEDAISTARSFLLDELLLAMAVFMSSCCAGRASSTDLLVTPLRS